MRVVFRNIVCSFFYLFVISLSFGQIPTFQASSTSGVTDVPDISNFYGHGASAADYDQDGDIDFYLTTINGSKDRLYRNNGDGTFDDVADQLGINITSGSRMAVWFDYNNDKRLDLIVLSERCATFKCVLPILINLLEQQEDGTFLDVTGSSGIAFEDKYDNLDPYAAGGMAVGDINNDNHLDLLVTVWGGKASFFINNGDGTFTDHSEESKIGLEEAFFWQPMFHDFDGDGAMDIYCNVDFGRNQLWLNKRDGTFQEVAAQTGLASDFSEMGMAINDYDNDGDFDIYSTNITRDFAGQHEHNVLLRNDSQAGFMVFNEVAETSKIADSGWDWGVTFFDSNNDGWVDLATTNGWNNDPDWGPDQSHFWLSSNGSFSDQSTSSGFNDMLSATGLIAFDADRDGDLDLLQTLKDNPDTKLPAILYENKLEDHNNAGNYLVVKPRMKETNHWAIGAVVKIRAGKLFNMRLISAGTSYYGQEPAEAYFGLGNQEIVDEIEVLWPDGSVSIFEDISANQVVMLENEIINAPAGLSVGSGDGSSTNATFSWIDNSDNETGFRIEKSATRNFNEYEEMIVGENVTSYVHFLDFNKPYFRVKAINDKATSAYSNTLNINVLSAMDNQQKNVEIYPNPTSGRFNVRLVHEYSGLVSFDLLDVSGRIIWSGSHLKNESVMELDQEVQVEYGVYLLRLQLGETTISRRILITD